MTEGGDDKGERDNKGKRMTRERGSETE